MKTVEELEKELKKQLRKNTLLEQALKQDSQLREKYSRTLDLLEKREEELRVLNNSLENKVVQRTKEIEELYKREHHIKEIMKIVADVNEFLVGAMNVKSIISNSIENICKHEHYKFSWFGMLNSDNSLEIIYKSKDVYNLIDKEVYSIDKIEDGIFEPVLKSIKGGKTVFSSKINNNKQIFENRRTDDYSLNSSVCVPLFYDNSINPFGVFCVYSDSKSFDSEEISILETLGKDIAFAISINKHRNVLEKLELEKITNYEETILAFVDIIEQRDAYTAGHTLRVAEYCRLIANEFDIRVEDIQKLEQAAILHDIGKVVTPDAILLKPGKLTALEYDLIKHHAVSGYQMLSKIAMYQDLAEIIKHHHERYDGTGYPDGLKGEEISLLTHIMIVSDAFDAMTTNRVYKERKKLKDALAELKSLSGTSFHPDVVEKALLVFQDIKLEQVDQLPHSDLEKKRFSYFFQDALTSAHNESYLELILNKGVHDFSCLNLLLLKDFSSYNRNKGWDKGNELLIKIARLLEKKFPNSEIFRFQGDDFVILHRTHFHVDIDTLNNDLEGYDVFFEHHHFDTKDFDCASKLIESLT